jgi:hypothetical protein
VIWPVTAGSRLKFQQLVINSLVEDGTIARVAWLYAGFLGSARR